MRARAQLKHDGSKAQTLNGRAGGLALAGEFLQRRADEDAQALIGCADKAL